MWSSLLLFVVIGVSAGVLRERFTTRFTRMSLFASGVLIPLAYSVENSILVSGV